MTALFSDTQRNKVAAEKKEAEAAYNAKVTTYEEKKKVYDQKKAVSDSKERQLQEARVGGDKFTLKAKRILEEVEKIEQEDQGLCTEESQKNMMLKDMDTKHKAQAGKISKKEEELANHRESLKTVGPPPEGIDKKIHKVSEQIKKLSEKSSEIQKKIREEQNEEKNVKNKIIAKEKLLDNPLFQDPVKQRMNALRTDNFHQSKTAYRARLWLGEALFFCPQPQPRPLPRHALEMLMQMLFATSCRLVGHGSA